MMGPYRVPFASVRFKNYFIISFPKYFRILTFTESREIDAF